MDAWIQSMANWIRLWQNEIWRTCLWNGLNGTYGQKRPWNSRLVFIYKSSTKYSKTIQRKIVQHRQTVTLVECVILTMDQMVDSAKHVQEILTKIVSILDSSPNGVSRNARMFASSIKVSNHFDGKKTINLFYELSFMTHALIWGT